MPFAGKQTEVEVNMLGKISQTQTGSIFSFICRNWKKKKKQRHVSEK